MGIKFWRASFQDTSNILDITGSLRLALHNSSLAKSVHPKLIEVPLTRSPSDYNFFMEKTMKYLFLFSSPGTL